MLLKSYQSAVENYLKKYIFLFGYLVFNYCLIFQPNNQEKKSFLSQNIYTNY